MDRKEAIKEAETQINVYESMILYNKDFEPKNDNSNYERKIEFLKVAIAALQEPERKKGQWKNGDEKCPICGKSKFEGLDADIWADWQPPFCPNCGSDMKGEEE